MPDMNQNRAPERREDQPGGQRQAPRAKRRRRRRRPLILTILIRIFQVIGTLLLIGIITGCFMACYAAVYVRTVVMPKSYLNLDDYNMDENSVIVYEDKETHQLVELQTLSGKEIRELVEYKDIPEDLINAFIAVEDKRFPTHHGVDWMRTANGLLRMFTGGNIQGGSTITQQLIKNLTEYDDITVTRKILEIFTALELESNYSKEVILTTYFNEVYMGNRCRGVQAASKYYFGKDVWDLTLAECASLAGITNNPSLYAPYGTVEVVRYQCTNPECKLYSLSKDDVCEYCGAEHSYDNGAVWTNRDYNKARQERILKLMADPEISPDGAYITAAERDAAIAQPLVFRGDRQDIPEDPDDPDSLDGTQEQTPSGIYSWYVEAVIQEATRALMEQTGLKEDVCRQRVFSGGLTIVCAYDPDAQAAVDTVFNDRSNLDQVSSRTGQRLMSAISLVDNSTGYVVAMGSTEEKTVNRGWNTPVDTKRQPGSSIKPLSVYGPALDMGLITPATVVDDCPKELNGKAWPINVTPTYKGLTTVLDAVTRSLNTVAVRVLDVVTPQEAYNFMVDKFGITSLVAYLETPTGRVLSDLDPSPLALGGLTAGVSTYEMAAAYATFPRDGAFTRATTVLEIRDHDGRVIKDNRPKTEFVIKETTAYYINSMLTNVVTSGTGTPARISGQTVAGKTGTTQDVYDYWFCGYTSYYTAAVWTGYPSSEVINYNHNNPSVPLWQKVMAILHEDKENQAFDVPKTLNSYYICQDCGKRATVDCENDVRGNHTQTFRLFEEDAPRGFCECHVPIDVCMDCPVVDNNGAPTGYFHLAGDHCPAESVKTVYVVNYQRELTVPVTIGDSRALISFFEELPEEFRYCYVHTTAQAPEPPEPPEPIATDEPWVLPPDWPGIDPPVVSDQPFVEPTADPWPSTEPWPTFDPPAVDTPNAEPFVPVGGPDQGGGGWGDTGQLP